MNETNSVFETMPDISIIIPLYNKAPYIGAAINSVLAQTITDWELWVVDNNSTDNGLEIVQKYCDPRIHLISCPKRTGGPGAPRNVGLRHATGTWVLFLDADDTIESTHLENLLSPVEDHPDAAIIAGHWQEYTNSNPQQRTLKAPAGYGSTAFGFPDGAIAFASWAVHSAIVRRDILHTPFIWVEALDRYMSEDTAFWFRLTSTFSVAYTASAGALYRQEIEDNRNQPDVLALWFQSMKAITTANIEFLSQQQRSLTAKHCESLMRLYSDIYLKARLQNDATTADEAMEIAKEWLKECSNRKGCRSFSLRVREVLGLHRFLSIIYWQQNLVTTVKVNYL
ncbi:glycosyltransferase family 2 protein [Moorena sp. SIO3I6]|uniref:glycosyltransferase family 2 protein n=1 Tax=Moorena sp. SIO3I6 TaxID=2607831 RepID=UPI0013FB2530|nr:glycosyltransferase family 2 protein [Moorena sp. SIO3I6]NEP22343.1 glycosyltransferase family 2 protein [Moorena sp. SIO3I6]